MADDKTASSRGLKPHFCPNCERTVPSYTVTRDESYPVLGVRNVTITATVRICDICGEDIWDRELDDVNLLAAYKAAGWDHKQRVWSR